MESCFYTFGIKKSTSRIGKNNEKKIKDIDIFADNVIYYTID